MESLVGLLRIADLHYRYTLTLRGLTIGTVFPGVRGMKASLYVLRLEPENGFAKRDDVVS